jgi:hypothetical protein
MRQRNRRFITVLAVVTIGGAAIGGCNSLSGIGDFSVESEAGQAPGDALPDQTASESSLPEAALDGTTPVDATAPQDVAAEATGAEAGDARPDSLIDDAGHKSDASDASSAPDVTATCGMSVCASPVCCDGGCATTHFNGLGQFFYDCAPAPTFNVTQAYAACTAFTGNMSQCTANTVGCSSGNSICSTGASTCACWVYDGSNAGHVVNFMSPSCNCVPKSSGTWN